MVAGSPEVSIESPGRPWTERPAEENLRKILSEATEEIRRLENFRSFERVREVEKMINWKE